MKNLRSDEDFYDEKGWLSKLKFLEQMEDSEDFEHKFFKVDD